jgi:hypothetical protein
MGFLQQFHLVIRYKKGIFNKVVDMLSRPIISASVILKHSPIMHESYVEQYALDTDFKEVYETLCHSNHVEELDYHVHNSLLYHLGKLCIPQGERINNDHGEHIQIPSIDDFSPEYLTELHEDTILNRRMRTSKRGNVEYLRVGLKGTNPSKTKWIEVGRVRELYPDLQID